MNEHESKLAAITETVDKLRHDLSATWQALGAMQTMLTPEQRAQVLQTMALASAQKQEHYDALQPTPAIQAKVQHSLAGMQAAEQRLHALLQGFPAQLQAAPGHR